MTTFFCPNCSAQVQLVVDKIHQYEYEEDNGCYFEARFGHCAVCSKPALVRFLRLGNDQRGDPFLEFDAQLFPVSLPRVSAKLPPRVEESYGEAIKCAAAEAWLATAVMVRRTLEAIGQEFDPDTKNAFGGLARMKEKGVISEELWQWGDELRFLGNTGAHPRGEKIQDADAKDALEFLNAIIHNIYVLRPKFQAMQLRRPSPRGSPSKSPTDADH